MSPVKVSEYQRKLPCDRMTLDAKRKLFSLIGRTTTTGKEQGATLCGSKGGPVTVGFTCEGDECSISSEAFGRCLGGKRVGTFHTHPLANKYQYLAGSDNDLLHATAMDDETMCVGGDLSTGYNVACYEPGEKENERMYRRYRNLAFRPYYDLTNQEKLDAWALDKVIPSTWKKTCTFNRLGE